MQILSCVIACWSFFDGCIKLRQADTQEEWIIEQQLWTKPYKSAISTYNTKLNIYKIV